MDYRSWLAGVAAVTLAGTLPAAAQAPRSLFAEAPVPSSPVPVTMGLEPALSLRPTEAARPPQAEASTPPAGTSTSSDTQPDKPAASAAKPDQPESHQASPYRFAARMDLLPPRRPASLVPSLPAAEPAADQALSPAMSRAERRRAQREASLQAAAPAAPQTQPASPDNPFQALFGIQQARPPGQASISTTGRAQIDALVSYHARLNNVPESLVHRIIVRESKYNARAVGRGGALGLMQIKTATARGVGYTGGPGGLLDAETNLTYGIKYLAGAWRVSGGSYDRAVSHYARGYYYEAKRQGLAGAIRGRRGHRAEPEMTASAAPQTPSFLSLFSRQASAQ